MTLCPSCGTEGPDGARFCPACGSELSGRPGMATELKVVTVLFCDLVGFTALCERTDPEDVDRVLRDYYAFASELIERYGGSVEKFIGDAVVGAFGVPSAHEDDAERAVRAGWRLIEGVADLPGPAATPLAVRVGVNTGPAIVRLDVNPRSGTGFLVGDAVNTAQRLQTMAPPSGLVVGDVTRSLAENIATFEALVPSKPKGKSKTIQPWLVSGLVSRTGIDLRQHFSTPLVGREVELAILKGLFEKARASSTPQFALISGEAGIGKTRLIFELARWIDEQPDLFATWRQGRCLPYGEGVSFRPLAEIVRAHAGIVETDDPEMVAAKLERAVGTGPDDWWVAERLRPLLGLPSRPASQDENFAAWAWFLDAVAVRGPAVIVVDDLHWADEGLLSFAQYLVERDSAAPLLFVAAARPELLETLQDRGVHLLATGDHGQRAVRIDVRSLLPDETDRLIDGLSVVSVPPEVTSAIVERGGGNPFYTEELVRLLQVDRRAGVAPFSFAALPDSLQALVIARLDSLKPEQKAVLADAAVVGQTFWPSVVSELGGVSPGSVTDTLRELASREFVRPSPEAGLDGEPEFTFRHAITRDAMYSQLPRATRAAKHAVLAPWFEARVTAGAGDLVEAAAHHYVTALDLLEAVGGGAADDLRQPAIRALTLAGDTAVRLNARAAVSHYARALDLSEGDSPSRLPLQAKLATALGDDGRLEDARTILETAVRERRAAGDSLGGALAMSHLSRVLMRQADSRAMELAAEAVDMLGPFEVSAEAAKVLEHLAMLRVQTGDRASVLDLTERVVKMCDELGIPTPHMTLGLRGYASYNVGAREKGLDDVRAAIETAEREGSSGDIAALLDVAAVLVAMEEGAGASAALRRDGVEAARRRRDELAATYLRIGLVEDLVVIGEWEEALAEAADVLGENQASGHVFHQAELEAVLALVLMLQGDTDAAEPHVSWLAERQDSMVGLGLIGVLAVALHRAGLADAAGTGAALEKLVAPPTAFFSEPTALLWWPEAVRTARRVSRPDLCTTLTAYAEAWATRPPGVSAALRALEEEQRGALETAAASHEAAAQAWPASAFPYERAQACLGRGRCLLALGRVPEAAAAALEAREIFACLGARPALAEAERLLQEAGAASGLAGSARLR